MKTAITVIMVIAVIAVAALLAYKRLLPTFWKAPYVTAEVPSAAKLGDDIKVSVTVHAVHKNVRISEIRFFPEGYFSSSVIPGNLLYPIILKKGDPKDNEAKGFKEISRETRPAKWTYNYDVPLGEVYYEGKLAAGTLKGRIDVIVDYPDLSAGRVSGGGYPAIRQTLSYPFKIELHE